MTERGHILVTSKGLQLQKELNIGTNLDEMQFTSTNSTSMFSPLNHVIPKAQSISLKKPAFLEHVRSGYFGPKRFDHDTQSPGKSSHNTLYPNYLKKSPQEYPQKHSCSWIPKATTKSPHNLPIETNMAKYIHYTLFDSEHNPEKLSKKTTECNKAAFGKYYPLTVGLTTEISIAIPTSPAKAEKAKDGETTRRSHIRTLTNIQNSMGQSNFFTKTGQSIDFRSSVEIIKETKEERIRRKYEEHQRKFAHIIMNCDEEVRRKAAKALEYPLDQKDFEERMQTEYKEIADMKYLEDNEKARFGKRINELQKSK